MSISSIGGCSAAQTTQATQYRSSASTSSAAATGSTTGAAQDGSAFINAIASALSDIGVPSSASSASADPATAATDASATPAKALGDFLHTLMEALHAQGGGQQQGPGGPQGAGAPPPPPPSAGQGGGIESDLQSLVSSLNSSSTESTTGSTDTDLAASFKNLLGALGVDSADSSSKLGQFLQTLSAKLETSGSSGNLINTSA